MLEEAKRSKNLRQLLIRASRTLNAMIAEELDKNGYVKVRPAHSALLANLEFGGSSVTDVADRAGMTKQAMGLLVAELVELGYIARESDERDKRAHVITLTESGQKLMSDTLRIVDDIEVRYSNILGEQTMDGLRTGLAAFMGVRQID